MPECARVLLHEKFADKNAVQLQDHYDLTERGFLMHSANNLLYHAGNDFYVNLERFGKKFSYR